MAEQTQEELLNEQKKNCIFCKIVSGEIPSKKIYEDDEFLAILDINPIVSGHVLLMPKDHIPILAIMPEDLQRNLFGLGAKLSNAVQEAMISQRMTIVCQSGYSAGQRPPFHIMLHLLPREKGDGLEKFDLEKQDVNQADTIALAPLLEQATKQVIAYFGRNELLQKQILQNVPDNLMGKIPIAESNLYEHSSNKPNSVESNSVDSNFDDKTGDGASESNILEFSSTNDALEHVLAMSPDLRNFIIMQPDLIEYYIKKSSKLKKLFEGVNLLALSAALRSQDAQTKKTALDASNNSKPQVKELSAKELSAKELSAKELSAKEMSDKELFAFIDANEGLRVWLLEHPKELSENIDKNQKLQIFFDGMDIIELSKKYRGYLLKGGKR